MKQRFPFRTFALLCAAVASCSVLAPSVHAEGQRPNMIFVMTDDQGYGDMSCHGNPWLKTPNLDRLHDEGVSLEDYHVDPAFPLSG